MQINVIKLTLFSHNFTSSGCALSVAVEALCIDVLELGQLALKSMDREKERKRESENLESKRKRRERERTDPLE